MQEDIFIFFWLKKRNGVNIHSLQSDLVNFLDKFIDRASKKAVYFFEKFNDLALRDCGGDVNIPGAHAGEVFLVMG